MFISLAELMPPWHPSPLIKRKIDILNYKIVEDGNLNACWKVSTVALLLKMWASDL